MGEEFSAESPFMFFADFIDPKLRKSVDRGRRREYPHHDWSRSLSPSHERAFFGSKLEVPVADNLTSKWYKQLIKTRKDWRAKGALDPASLEVRCDIDLGVFGFFYQSDVVHFVLARLGKDSGENLNLCEEARSWKIEMNSRVVGESRLDGSEFDRVLEWNHAIVGVTANMPRHLFA